MTTGDSPSYLRDLSLFAARFLVTIMMHLYIFHEFKQSFNIMKYVNNHPSRFDYQPTAFSIGAIHCVNSFYYSAMNVLILYTRINVYFTTICYVTVYCIQSLGITYLKALRTDKNNVTLDVFLPENRPRVVNHRSDVGSWQNRSKGNKCQRLLYKALRGFYVACIFYFFPFFFLYMHQMIFVWRQFTFDLFKETET